MQRYLIAFCLLSAIFIMSCQSNDSSKPDVSCNESLLVITSYIEFPNNRLTVIRNGTYTWEHFNTENLTWQTLLSGNLEQGELADIEKQLVKSTSGLHLTRRIKVKNQYGKEVELVISKVVRENDHFIYNFSDLESSTMWPDVIKVVLDKCDYIKVLNLLGYTVD